MGRAAARHWVISVAQRARAKGNQGAPFEQDQSAISHRRFHGKQGAATGDNAVRIMAFAPFVTYPDAPSDRTAEMALHLASGLDARLHAMAINADIPDVSNALSRLLLNTPEMVRQANAASRRRGEHLLTLMAQAATQRNLEIDTWALAAPIALLGETAAIHARYFDLNLLGWEAGSEAVRSTAEAIVFESGKPTLLFPPMEDVPQFDHVAIAWDGGRAAARAVSDARPILERAKRVSVITAMDEKPFIEADVGERLARTLCDRGMDAKASAVMADDRPIGQALQEEAKDRGCAILVMGGYGHSRVREFVLGGATEGILAELSMPVLISH